MNKFLNCQAKLQISFFYFAFAYEILCIGSYFGVFFVVPGPKTDVARDLNGINWPLGIWIFNCFFCQMFRPWLKWNGQNEDPSHMAALAHHRVSTTTSLILSPSRVLFYLAYFFHLIPYTSIHTSSFSFRFLPST